MDAGVEPLRYDRIHWATLIRQSQLAMKLRWYRGDNWAQYPADPDKMVEGDGNYRFVTLHHTGSKDTPEDVESLHWDKLGAAESLARKIGEKLGLAQTYSGQGDISYNYLVSVKPSHL